MVVLPAGYCGGSTNRIYNLAGYRHGSTLVDVGKSVVNVLSPVNPAHENAKSTGCWTIANAIVTGVAGYTILIQVWPWL